MSETNEKLENFLRAFGAARVLLQQSHEHGALIEGVVLYAALVDGLCRICLILNYQITNNTSDIPIKYIYQNQNEKNYSEREIYTQTFNKGIIDEEIYSELNALYDVRNKIVHRFFISEVEYSHMELACNRYERLFNTLNEITYKLESKQIDMGVGMTIPGDIIDGSAKAEIIEDIYKKIKTKDERNLAKTFNTTSVVEIVEFAAQHGLIRSCLCGHPMMRHIDMLEPKDPLVPIEDLAVRCMEKECACMKFEKDLNASEYLSE